MFQFSWIALAVLLQAALGEPMESEASRLRCRLTEVRPAIDGTLDEACWLEADIAKDFVLLERGGPATQQTECMAAYDAENLYVAFRCRESDSNGIRVQCTERDGRVWLDDCVEVFLDTLHDHCTYFHLITNSIATRFDEIGPRYPRPESWDGDWCVATHVSSDGYSVEIAIPFHSLASTMPRPGTIWGFNVNRQEYRLFERSSWSPTQHSFHEPRNFGHLFFVPES
jgi:hypothetical protein